MTFQHLIRNTPLKLTHSHHDSSLGYAMCGMHIIAGPLPVDVARRIVNLLNATAHLSGTAFSAKRKLDPRPEAVEDALRVAWEMCGWGDNKDDVFADEVDRFNRQLEAERIHEDSGAARYDTHPLV
tara:strand:+ start:690 stop:1067 length:378 start_codon:yes stop_codon:yes gene_type:complete